MNGWSVLGVVPVRLFGIRGVWRRLQSVNGVLSKWMKRVACCVCWGRVFVVGLVGGRVFVFVLGWFAAGLAVQVCVCVGAVAYICPSHCVSAVKLVLVFPGSCFVCGIWMCASLCAYGRWESLSLSLSLSL